MIKRLSGLYRHWRAGTLGKRLLGPSVDDKVRWHGADNESEALQALVARGRVAVEDGPENAQAMILDESGGFGQRLAQRLQNENIAHRQLTLTQAMALPESEMQSIAIVLCADAQARAQTRAAREIANHPILGKRPFEHAAGLDNSRATFAELDEYAATTFVSPVLLDDPTPYEIYQQSLHHFEQKCGLRDYLDLYHLLKSVVERGVSGDIAEFGSFRGHSGWLIARSLQALGSDKKLFMFDTFDAFPTEQYGVDHFWSATHSVNYAQVKAKFADMPHVTLVKGDFTQTLDNSGVAQLALAYVDCDSYRATRYLLETLPEHYLPKYSLLVCEDYGHPALLGNRVAVHEAFDGKPGWFRYFSQFSGLYVALKLD